MTWRWDRNQEPRGCSHQLRALLPVLIQVVPDHEPIQICEQPLLVDFLSSTTVLLGRTTVAGFELT
jgi:hypothetical protein